MLGDSKVGAIVPTHDIAGAKGFYENTLGAKVVGEMPGNAIRFECLGGSEFLLYETTVAVPAEHTCMYFMVDDLDGTIADLESRGVTFEEYDPAELGMDGSGPTKVIEMDGIGSAWFTDPEGNIIAVTAAPS